MKISRSSRVVILLLVIIAHITLMVLFLHHVKEMRDKIPPPPKPPAEVNLMQDKDFAGAGNGSDPCSQSYVGIGIGSFSGTIFEVAPGSPADLADIRIGDDIINHEILGRDRYPAGTSLPLLVERMGKQSKIIVVTGVICEKDR